MALPRLWPMPMLALLVLSEARGAGSPPRAFPLAPSNPGCPRRLPPGGDAYEVDLAAGEYLHATFDQQGTDLAVTVFAPGHRKLYKVDSLNGRNGPEEIHLVSQEAGRYRFEVTGEPGSYCPRLLERRPPSPVDRQWAAADRDLYLAPDLSAGKQEERYRQASALFAETGDRWHQAVALYDLGRRLAGDHRYGEAIDPLERADALFAAAGDRHLALVARIEKGQCQSAGFDFDPALATFESALDLARQLGEIEMQAITLHGLGMIFETRGETWQALDSFRDAIALWQTIPGPEARENEANSLTGMGWVYASTGDWKGALQTHCRALRLRKQFSSPDKQAISALQVGAMLRHTTPFLAPTFINKAWKLQAGSSDGHDRAATLNGLGLVLTELGHHREAQERFQEALRLYGTGTPDRIGQASTWLHLGMVRLKLGALEEAFQSFEQALELGRQAGDRRVRVQALLGLAEVELLRHRLRAAQEWAEEALALCEDIRIDVGRVDLQTSYLADNIDLYHLLISILMEQHRDPEAFDLGEQARARSLLDALLESHELRLDRQAGVPSELLDQLQPLRNEIDRLARQRGRPGSVPTSVEQRLAERIERLHELNLKIKQSRGATPQALPHFNSEEARRLLEPDTLLLEYSLGKQNYLWAVSAGNVQSFHLAPRKELEPLLRAVARQLATEEGTTDDSLRRLSRLLLGPVAGLLGHKRLLIAADGGAQYLPFAVLPDPNGPPKSPQPLLVDHEIDYVPSLAVLAEIRERQAERAPAPRPLAIVANPVFNSGDERLPPGAETCDWDFLRRLPKSKTEANGIAALLLPPGKAFRALDLEASRELVTDGRLGSYRILHFATHGTLDTEYPDLSGLVFSRFDAQGRCHDGNLRVSDLQYLDLPADLVVLSACQTALGRETPGEGLVGLPQAFLTAGASSVVVSLWDAEDRSTAYLMTELYRRLLREHQPPGQALREAQLATRERRGWEAPRYWAAFVLQGDWQPVF